MNIKALRGFSLATSLAAILGATAAMAEIDERKFEVVVGNHQDSFTTDLTLPFFNDLLPERSGGKLTANAVPYTELGLSGYELMDLLKLGTTDISWAVIGYASANSPVIEGLELPGLTDNVDTFYKALDAYRPLLAEQFGQQFNAKLVMAYAQPELQAYCKLSEDEIANFTLDTLRGKKVRVHSTAYADFAEALGAVPVTMSFADVIPALERGVLDCAITSPNVVYSAGMFQVTNAVIDLPGGFSSHVFSISNNTMNSLNEETQAFLNEQFAELQGQLTAYTAESMESSAACLHTGPCELGEPANMALISMTEEDNARLKTAVEDVVLRRWAERCGADCAEQWNGMVGDIFDMTASAN